MAEDKVPDFGPFLIDLAYISNAHRVVIGGCGCCGSPYLMKVRGLTKEGRYEYKEGLGNGLQWVDGNE